MTSSDLQAITRPLACPLTPGLSVPALPDHETLDIFRTRHAELIGAGVPYWAVSWPGGQALARFLLDRPDMVADRRVIDLGCGSGLIAAAAMRAGAASVLAVDHDPNALVAAEETARTNGVTVETALDDLETLAPEPGAVICAGDLWYEPITARRATATLTRLAAGATLVLFADPGRPGRPRLGIVELACYRVPVREEFERAGEVETRVFKLADRDILAATPGSIC
ncbi:MAG: 50S ribosomal protein L11 methyltransferase [Paracoccaceae bacterium]|nr:50S ribosomal protein L11 methyltransferase [Paracoccaceae bacterium]